MSRIFDALRKSELQRTEAASRTVSAAPSNGHQVETSLLEPVVELDRVPTVHLDATASLPETTSDPGAETFRVLRHRLELIRRQRQLQKLLVTSAVPNEGKTTVACRLAAALARSSARVLLVDGDLRHPGVHRALGLTPHSGLADWLEHRVELPSVLRQIQPHGFFYLPSGEARSNPGELLRQAAFAEFLTATAATFDWVVVDSPPLGPFVDAHHLATLVDGVLVVLRCGVTPRTALEQISTSLERVFVAGVVLNETKDRNRSYYQYYGRQHTVLPTAGMAAAAHTSDLGTRAHE